MTINFVAFEENGSGSFSFSMYFDTSGEYKENAAGINQYLDRIGSLGIDKQFIAYDTSVALLFGDESSKGVVCISGNPALGYTNFTAIAGDLEASYEMVRKFKELTGFKECHVPDDILAKDTDYILDTLSDSLNYIAGGSGNET